MGVRRFLGLLALLGACSNPTPDTGDCSALESRTLWSVDDIPTSAPECAPEPAAPRDLSDARRLAVAVYHFNIQYVAGGLRGFPDGEIVPTFDLGEVEVEDRIVRQGLEPVLDLFLRNESFHADIELQAYMVEVIARRHPDVLEKMRTLAEKGQIDFDSFHYSDELYIAYPKTDLEVSLDLTQRVYRRSCLPLGRSIFTQEGQFARGQLPIAEARGYEVSILPKNLFRYQFGTQPLQQGVLFQAPEAPEHTVLIGGQSWTDTATDGVELRWLFMDDGEIAFTKQNLNPYFGLDYEVDPAQIEAHEARLAEMESMGFVHATVAEAVRALKARGVPARPLPPVLDGVWQPDDTDNVGRWMGGSGLFRTQESDSELLGLVWHARTAVARVAERAQGLEKAVEAAWREVLLAQVSDSTGWNPFRNEVEYSRTHAAEAEALAADIARCLPEEEPRSLELDCGAERELDDLGVEVIATSRPITTHARECTGLGGRSLTELVIEAEKTADEDPLFDASAEEGDQRELLVRVQRAPGSFFVAQALEDEVREVDLSDFQLEEIALPLADGLIGLGAGRFLIQDLASGRTAAKLSSTSTTVDFQELTLRRSTAHRWRFFLFDELSPSEALELARDINR